MASATFGARREVDGITSPWPVAPTVTKSELPRTITHRASCTTLVRRARVRGGESPTGSTRPRKTCRDSRRGAIWMKVDERLTDDHDPQSVALVTTRPSRAIIRT